MSLRVLVLYTMFGISWGTKLGPGVELCHKSDPEFYKCMDKQVGAALYNWKDGVRELGVPRLEPFDIPKVEIIPGTSQSIALAQKYENVKTYGIYISDVYDGKYIMNETECYWDLWVLTPNVYIEADFELKGNILIFSLNSKGRCNISITNMRNHHISSCERYQKKGKTHLRFNNYNIDINAEKVYFDFDNLIQDNVQLNSGILKALNENAMAIFNELKFGFATVWNGLHRQTQNNVLSHLTEDEAFPSS